MMAHWEKNGMRSRVRPDPRKALRQQQALQREIDEATYVSEFLANQALTVLANRSPALIALPQERKKKKQRLQGLPLLLLCAPATFLSDEEASATRRLRDRLQREGSEVTTTLDLGDNAPGAEDLHAMDSRTCAAVVVCLSDALVEWFNSSGYTLGSWLMWLCTVSATGFQPATLASHAASL